MCDRLHNSLKLEYNLLIFTIYYIIFGGLIFKFIHIPNNIGLTLVSLGDCIPIIIWLIYIPVFKYNNKSWLEKMDIWVMFILLLILTISRDYKYSSNISSTIAHIGVMVRYIPIALIVSKICRDDYYVNLLISKIDVVSRIILLFSWLSIILGSRAEILFPVLPLINTAERELINGFHSAIFPNTIDLGFVLNILFLFKIYRRACNWNKFTTYLIMYVVPIIFTGSVASFAMLFLISVIWIYNKSRHVGFFIFVVLSMVFLCFYIRYHDYIYEVYEVAQYSRLGVITVTLPDFLKEMSNDTLFGVGTGIDVIYNKVNSYPEKVHILEHLYELGGFADVYWVSLIINHGVIGFLIFSLILFYVYRSLKSKQYKITSFEFKPFVNNMFLMVFLLGFLNQVLAVRPFALFFWIFVGFVYSQKAKSGIKNNHIYSIADMQSLNLKKN